MKKISILSLAVFGLVFTACDGDDDNNTAQDLVAPQIQSATINSKSADIEAPAGNDIHVDAHLTDNEWLGQLKVDIHDQFDGHAHGKRNEIDWAEVRTIDLSGKEEHIHEDITVPGDAKAGPYHAIFRVIDREGNEGQLVELDFTVTNGTQPVINITAPDFNDHVDVTKGATLDIMGTITDDTDLDEIVVVLEEEHDDHMHGKTNNEEPPIYEEDFDLTGSSDTSWDFQTDGGVSITIPTDAEAGDYKLEVIATDSDGNVSIFEGEVHIM